MQIQKSKTDGVEIKTKKAVIYLDGNVKINEVELEGMGEYEVAEVAVEGIDDNTYIFQTEELTIGAVNFTCKIVKEVIEKLSNTKIVIVKLNGNISEAVEQVGQIEPDIAIYLGDEEAEKKLHTSGVTVEKTETLKITKADLEGDQKAYFIQVQNAKCESPTEN